MLEQLRQKGEPKNGVREKRSAIGLDCPQKKRSNLAEPTALPIFRPSAPMLAREAKAYVVCPEGKYLYQQSMVLISTWQSRTTAISCYCWSNACAELQKYFKLLSSVKYFLIVKHSHIGLNTGAFSKE